MKNNKTNNDGSSADAHNKAKKELMDAVMASGAGGVAADAAGPDADAARGDPNGGAQAGLAGIVRASKSGDGDSANDATGGAPAKSAAMDGHTKVAALEIDLDDGIVASGAVKDKFKRLKEEARAIRAELIDRRKELDDLKLKYDELGKAGKSSGTDEDPRVRELTKKLSEMEDAVGALRLEESAKFKERFDNKISGHLASAADYIKATDDPELIAETVSRLDAAVLGILPGKDHNAKFLKAVSSALADEKFDPYRDEIKKELADIRRLKNDRATAIDEWKKTKSDIAASEDSSRDESAKGVGDAYDKEVSGFLDANAKRIEAFKKNDEYFMYSDVERVRGLARADVVEAARTGRVSPDLIKLVNMGVEYPVIERNLALVAGLMKDIVAENARLSAQLKKIQEGDAGGGSRDSRVSADGDGELGGILATKKRILAGS